jgi:hypothetical protein
VTDQQKADYIKSLLEERRYCERWGQDERVKDINAELRKAGHESAAPAKRAESRPRATKTKKSETR